MNLARFGLTRNSKGEIVEDGSEEWVQEKAPRYPGLEIPELEHLPGVCFGAPQLGAAAGSTRSKASRRRREKKVRRFINRRKNTSKEFVAKMKVKFDLLDLKKPIPEMEKSELLAHFGEGKGKKLRKVDKKKFAFNCLWQLYGDIQAGRAPEFAKVSCNLRTIYYYYKQVFREHPSIFDKTDNIYDNFPRAMKAMVLAGLLSYKDLRIVDDRRAYRSMPPSYGNTNVILLAEKEGFVGRFFQLGAQYGVITQITRGVSSLLMADSMLTEMFEAGYDLKKPITILSFCDFDPVGSSIPIHFVKHLKALGFTNVKKFKQYGDKTMTRLTEGGKRKRVSQVRPCLDVVNPHDLPSNVRNKLRHSLKAKIRDNPTTADWAFVTGGVTGTGRNKQYAITSELLLPYLAEHLDEKIRPLLEKPPEVFGRRLNYSYLRTCIREYIGARAERGLLNGI